MHYPQSDEYSPRFGAYIQSIAPTESVSYILDQQVETWQSLMLDVFTGKTATFRYANDKWTPNEVLLHIIDTERILVYRALSIARGMVESLPGFDEEHFVSESVANMRTVESLLKEFSTVRESTKMFVTESIPQHAFVRRGIANQHVCSVQALIYTIIGHCRHHISIIHERYIPLL